MKKPIYNSRYGEGSVILLNLRSDRLRRSYDTYSPISKGIINPVEERPTVDSTLYNNEPITYDEDGDVIQVDNGSIFSGIGEFVFGDYHHAKERWDEASIADSWRLFHEKRLLTKNTNLLNQISQTEDNLNTLKAAEDYANLIDEREKLREDLTKAIKSGNEYQADKIKNRLYEVSTDIAKFVSQMQLYGKNNDINIDLFFNAGRVSKNKDYNTDAEVYKTNLSWDKRQPVGIGAVLSWIENIVQSAAIGVGNLLGEGDEHRFTKRAIKLSMPHERWTDLLFESYDPDDKKYRGGVWSTENTDNLRDKILPKKDYFNRELNRLKLEQILTATEYKNGNWLFDPQKINPKFRYYSEHNDRGIIGAFLPDQILYSFAEVGSSWSDVENMVAMLAADVAAGYGASKLINFALRRNPYANALITLDSYKTMRSIGKVKEADLLRKAAIEAENTISATNKAVQAIDAVGKGTALGSSIYFIHKMREHETNSEVIDAWSNRVLENAMNNRADMLKVINVTKDYLTSIGIPTANMTDIDVVLHAISYNIPTGDAVFEKEKNKARAGLSKVYNDNMSLAVKDYVEVLPFLSYQGSVLKSIGRGLYDKFSNLTYRAVAGGLFDSRIEKGVDKFIAGNNLFKKLSSKHVLNYLDKSAKGIMYIGTMEGIEEGQQHLLLQRYNRGEYDFYNQPLKQFSLPSVFEGFRLGTDATAAYLGILYGDPDNGTPDIRNAMQIGAAAGILGGGLGIKLASNILPSEGRDNLRNLIAQLRNDDVIVRMYGDNFGKAQDDAHMNILYDAMSKYGVSKERLEQSLQDLKSFKGENVTNEYINRDIEILNDLWYTYHSDTFNENAKNDGVEKDSEEFKNRVKRAAKKRLNAREHYRNIKEQLREQELYKYSVMRKLYNEELAADGLESDIDGESAIFLEKVLKDYEEYLKKHEKELKEKEKALKEKIHDIETREVTQEWELPKAQEELEKFNNSNKDPLNFHDFLEKSVNNIITYNTLINAELLQEDLTTKQNVLNIFSRELGLDIPQDKIQPFIDRVILQKEEIEKTLEDEEIYNRNQLIKKVNESRKKGLEVIPLIKNIAARVRERYGTLPNQKDLDLIQLRFLISRAYYDVISPLNEVYFTGKMDPRVALSSMAQLSWKQLSKEEQKIFLDNVNKEREEQGKAPIGEKAAILEFAKRQRNRVKPMKKLVEDYVKHLHEHKDQDDVLDVDIDAESMEREAASMFTKYEQENFETLNRINHREFLRDNTSTVQLEELAKNGDQDSKTVLIEHIDRSLNESIDSNKKGTADSNEREETSTNNPRESSENREEGGYNPRENVETLEGGRVNPRENVETLDEDKKEPIVSSEQPEREEESPAEKRLREKLGIEDDKPVIIPKENDESVEEEEKEDPRINVENYEESPNVIESDESIDDLDYLSREQQFLIDIDDFVPSPYDDYLKSQDEKTVETSNLIYSNYLSQTFKYQPNSTVPPEVRNVRIRRDKDGNPIKENGVVLYDELPVVFKNNGVLKTGKELNQHLLIPGWFEKTDKYFIVTVDEKYWPNTKNPDAFNVILVIQYGLDVYCTFMQRIGMQLNQQGGVLADFGNEVYDKMDTMYYSSFRTQDSNGEVVEHIVKDESGKINKDVVTYGKKLVKTSQYKSAHPGVDMSKLSQTEIQNAAEVWYSKLPQDKKDIVDEKVRRFLSGGSTVFSNQKIRDEITKLRLTRMSIIDACLNKDENGYIFDSVHYKIVSPMNPRISAGRINVQYENDLPVFRKMTEGGFGMSTDIEELTRQIREEEVRLGVGLGERSFAYVEGQKAPIAKLDPEAPGDYNGTAYGHSGKIYFIAKTVQGDDRGVLLFEKKFKDYVEKTDPEDVYQVIDNNGEIIENQVPTISEFILRLVTNTISDKVFKGIPSEYIPQVKEELILLIVNATKSTWVKRKNEKRNNYFAKKLFFYDPETQKLIIALPNKGIYRHEPFDLSDIKNDETVRSIIIAAIENNLHWNTDRKTMVKKLPPMLLESLRQIFINNKDLTEYSIAGIEDLTFKKSDFFNDDMSLKDTSVVAWMISSGKLLTSAGDPLFDAPFVYADGPVKEDVANNILVDLVDESKKDKKRKKDNAVDLSKINVALNDYNVKRVGSLLYMQDKDARKKLLEGKSIKDFAILNINAKKDIGSLISDSVKKYLSFLKKEYGITIDEKSIEMPDEDDYAAVQSGQALFTANWVKDKVFINVDSIDDILKLSKQNIPVSGVFSTIKSEGTLNPKEAKQWLVKTLGLKPNLIVVTRGLLNGIAGAYGLTDVYVDALGNVVRGVISLRKDAGRGIHYHEAFHYVNMLLHSKDLRINIYKAYIQSHPEYEKSRNREIEELLAEDFREYCEEIQGFEDRQKNRSRFSRAIHRFFRNIIEFVNTWINKKDIIRSLFEDIRSGKYKGLEMDTESVEEFMKLYPEGIQQLFYVPGMKGDYEFKHIYDARTFFNVAESVAHQFLDFANIKKADSIANINKETFEKFFKKLKKDNLRNENPFIEDVIENPEAFIDTINTLLRRFGVVPKRKNKDLGKETQENENEDLQNNQGNDKDSLTNQADTRNEISQLAELYDNYTINKKENVAFRARLFLCQIKDTKFEFDDLSNGNRLVWKTDPTTGLLMYVSYDDAWNKITYNLYKIEDYNDLLLNVKRLANTKAFFAQLYENLLSIGDDIELQTQIFNAVNKHLTKVALMRILREKQKNYSVKYSDGSIAEEGSFSSRSSSSIKQYDQFKKLTVINDSAIKAKKMLPKDWSKDLFASPFVKFQDNVYSINEDYVALILQRFNEILDLLLRDKKLDSDQKLAIVDQIFPKLIKLLQMMCIPFDEEVLTEYVLMHCGERMGDSAIVKTDLYDGLLEILSNPTASKEKNANLWFFINTVFNASQTETIKVSKKKMKGLNISNYSAAVKLDEIYANYAGEMEKMAIAYNNVYPSSREESISGPNGNLIFPIGENNFMSDIVRWINKNHNQIINKLLETPYAKGSKVLEVARILSERKELGTVYEFKLNVFVGMDDENTKKGLDYFGITSLEDTISKMMMMNRSLLDGESVGPDMLVLPIMADKKTYYTLELVDKHGEGYKQFNMPHDLLISSLEDEYQKTKQLRRFSDATLERFSKYFTDELNSLDQYYNKENIKYLVQHKNALKSNFHGKVKDGRMDFSGNGGKFRYFYGLKFPGIYGERDISNLNLNQILEIEYLHQKEAEDPMIGGGLWQYRTDSEELDGFEGVRRRLKEIKDYFSDKSKLFDAINEMLFQRVDDQMEKFSRKGSGQIIKRKSESIDINDSSAGYNERYVNRAIPNSLVRAYVEKFRNDGRVKDSGFDLSSYDAYSPTSVGADITLSIIGNYVVQSMISTIEIEKVFAGDPAFYKWKYSKKTQHVEVDGRTYDIQILLDKDTDKIKRLGALLSPGSELRTDFTEQDYQKYPWLKGTKYTNAVVKDVIAKSIYLDELRNVFSHLAVADIIRSRYEVVDSDVKGENIWSGGSELARKLTNAKNNIAVEYKGVKFDNAEHAYLTWKSGEFNKKAFDKHGEKFRGGVNKEKSDAIMIEIITAKLQQHPELIDEINKKGGYDYIKNSRHRVIGTRADKHWETTSGGDNGFIKALLLAYTNVTGIDHGKDDGDRAQNSAEKNSLINSIYTDDDKYNEIFNSLTDELKKNIQELVESQIKPYKEITVSDALVLIRPELYRKIRMMLGQWTVIPKKITYKDRNGETHETYYSDDEAYNIIENDSDWMFDEEKAAKVSRLQLFPLKMTYFKNDPQSISVNNTLAYGLYNKMAIFPAFKFLFRSKTGRQIYERMNRAQDPLDMLTFESAVKVGAGSNIYSPYEDKTEDLSTLNKGLTDPSFKTVDKNDVVSTSNDLFKSLTVEIQDLRGLRMLLNTEAHDESTRAIGTQMFKILFGDIYDDEDYCLDKPGLSRKGKEIREDIMKCIKALTAIGAREIKKKFYNKTLDEVDDEKVLNYLKDVISNNNVSNTVLEVLENSGTIESLMQRTLFEQSVSSLVNSHVIDINTQGGSAIQQSVFGFVSYGVDQIRHDEEILELLKTGKWDRFFKKEDKYKDAPILNDGRELNWNEENGTMEIMLSMNFFKSVVPKKYQTTYSEMRQWLINHDIIKGRKIVKNPIYQTLRLKIEDPSDPSKFDLSITTEAIFNKLHIKTFGDILENYNELIKNFASVGEPNLIKEVDDVLNSVGLSRNTDLNLAKYIQGEWSKPNPFGVGYRIPTQGMSSTFGFVVADVLPEWCGDVVVVPREFTAQTGSDFDVDKLYLATMSYTDGILDEVKDDDFNTASKGAIANRLLKNYLDVVTDVKNRANAKGSIDTVTNIIQNSTLPAIRKKSEEYVPAMYELTPYFQMRRKQEFSVGKSGIGSFALNITNLALTQYAHISLDFSQLPIKLGRLDKVVGEDGIAISAWLSAMINAHVDVAKDPYIFDLNVNKATYNITNLLLRAGKGESTFLFLAQPALKEYADEYNNSSSIYGNYLYDDPIKGPKRDILETKIKSYMKYLEDLIEYEKQEANEQETIIDESGKSTIAKWKKYLDLYKRLEDETFDYNEVFNKQKAKKSLKNDDVLFTTVFLIMSLKALKALIPYGDELSSLVMNSRIDTKKFGNTLALQRDFLNEYNSFKYGVRDVAWINTDGSTENPLHKYFTKTFLEDKLLVATGLTRDILSSLTITGSKIFGNIMQALFCEIFGRQDKVTKDEQNNLLTLYNTIYDKRDVQELSNAAESVIRHKILEKYGTNVYKHLVENYNPEDDSFDYDKFEKDRNYTGPIDFTLGGDPEQVEKTYRRIMFGDPESNDVYERFSIFLLVSKYILIFQNTPVEKRKELSKIIDPSGFIVNELLNYLKPQPAGEKIDIPRLLLKKTNRNTFTDEKNKLISSFYDLFNFESESGNIRRLARDLALYTYYSQYNTNSPYSFFDLIPYEYRQQYDLAIAMGVKNKNIDFGMDVTGLNETNNYELDVKNLVDSICRNFYENDNIVPLFEIKPEHKPNKKFTILGDGTKVGPNVLYTKIPSYIFSTKLTRPYYKIKVKDDFVLYKRTLLITAKTNEGDNYTSPWYVFIPQEKLGVIGPGARQYELHVPAKGKSTFEDNNVLEYFDKLQVSLVILDLIKRSLEKIDEERAAIKNPRKIFSVKVSYEKFDVSPVVDVFESNLHKTIDQDLVESTNRVVEDVRKFINENSNEVIDLSSDDVTKQIEAIAKNRESSTEESGVSIGFVNISQPEATDEEVRKKLTEKDVEDYIEAYVTAYANKHNIKNTAVLDNMKKLQRNVADIKNIAKLYKFRNFVRNLYSQLGELQIDISDVYIEDSELGQLMIDVYNKSNYSFADNVILVSKKEEKSNTVNKESSDTVDKESSTTSKESSNIIEETKTTSKDSAETVEDKSTTSDSNERLEVETVNRRESTENIINDEPVQIITREMFEKMKLAERESIIQLSPMLKQSENTNNNKKC